MILIKIGGKQIMTCIPFLCLFTKKREFVLEILIAYRYKLFYCSCPDFLPLHLVLQ